MHGPSHPAVPTAKYHSFPSNQEKNSHFAWLKPLPKGVPPAHSERSCLVLFLVPPATKILWGIVKSRPQLPQQFFHALINKTHQISNRSKEHLHCWKAARTHHIAGNGLYSSLNVFIISLYPQTCSFYSSLLFLVFISSSHLHPWSIYSQKNQLLPALVPPSMPT